MKRSELKELIRSVLTESLEQEAQYYAGVHGQRGAATRLGNKKSGMSVFCNGWTAGVKIQASYNAQDDTDEFDIWITGGSGHGGSSRHIGTLKGDGTFVADASAPAPEQE